MFTFIAIIVVLLIIAIVAADRTDRSKERKEQLELQRWREKFDRDIEERNQRQQALVLACEDLVEADGVPVVFEMDDLPLDFDDKYYTTFDFETANRSPLSAISIGIAHFRGNTLLQAKEWLLSPIDKGEFEFTHIHGLRAEDVADAPTFEELFDEIKSELEGRHLVAHNA